MELSCFHSENQVFHHAGQRQDRSPGWRKYYRWARCAKAHLGELHIHMVGTVIHSSSGRLGILCVFRCLTMQPGLETATAGEGEGRLFLFLAARRLSPTSHRPAHPRSPLRDRAGRPQPAVLHPSDVPENLSPRLSIGPRSEVGSVSQSSGFCWKWETQTSW